MQQFVVLGKFTQEGIKTLQDAPEKLKEAMEAANSFGVELKELIYTMGHYDFIFIAEAANKEAISKMTLTRGNSGHLRTKTLSGFSKEFLDSIKDLQTV
jgi:uncharacterized protein with GYD domain